MIITNIHTNKTPPVEWCSINAQFKYFALMGFLYYDRFQSVLLDRQVLPFCHPTEGWYNEDLFYVQASILMGADRQDKPAKVMTDNSINIPEKELVHSDSWWRFLPADSMMGFTGTHYDDKRIKSKDVVLLQKLGNLGRFENKVDADIEQIMPALYVRVEDPSAKEIKVGCLLEMFDFHVNDWGWFYMLPDLPVTSSWPLDVLDWQFQSFEVWMIEEFSFLGPLYIGMPTLGPQEWKSTNGTKYGRRPGQIRNHALARVLEAPTPVSELEKLTDQCKASGYPLLNEVFHLVGHNVNNELCYEHMEDVLNGPARLALSQSV